jgi:membrane-bound ClpP family serine protease
MRKINYKYIFYTTVILFFTFFFFLSNDWNHRITLFILVGILFVIIKFAPKKTAGILVIIVFIVFRIIDELFISK